MLTNKQLVNKLEEFIDKQFDGSRNEFYLSENNRLLNGLSLDFKSNWPIPEEIKAGHYYFAFYLNSCVAVR
jgi:hypothetical protein